MLLFQSSSLRDSSLTKIVEAADKLGVERRDFGVIPFSHKIVGLDQFLPEAWNYNLMFVHCSVAAMTAIFYKTSPDTSPQLLNMLNHFIMYTDHKFEMEHILKKPYIARHMLNWDARIARFGDLIESKEVLNDVFVKPSSDRKEFLAGVVYEQTIEQWLSGQFTSLIDPDCMVQISSVKRTLAEWRIFMVNGKAAASSQYFRNGVVKPDRFVPRSVEVFAEWLNGIYEPHHYAYVVDICLTEDYEYKIVEYNCINCSGLYDCDVNQLLRSILQLS